VDVAVVGAGVTGLSVARGLGALGLRALVLERSGVAAGASGVQPGGVRQQWGTAVNCRLAREALPAWRATGGFRPCGYLFAAHSQETLERLRANVAVQNAAGVPSRLVSADEASTLVPGLVADGLAGAAWCAEDGYVDRPQAAIEALAHEVEIEIAEVAALDPGWTLALAGGSRVVARHVVVATGVDTPALLRPLGVDLPIEPESRWLFLSEPIRERLLEPLVVAPGRRFAAKQLADGRVLASDLSAVGASDEHAPRWRAAVGAAIRELLPLLAYVEFSLLVQGIYDVTPDRQAILGRVRGHDGLWVAAGFSGHGFMLAPAVGRILAAAIAGEAEDEALRVLDAGRVAEGRQLPEPAVV
jgi:sarcosine oxidase subunit beta